MIGNTVPSQFLSEVFRLFDRSDVTKKTKFILSGITSGNVRSLTIPDEDGVISLVGHTHANISILAGLGLSGGGALGENRTLAIDITEFDEDVNPVAATDYLITYDADDSSHKKVLLTNILESVNSFIEMGDTPNSYDSADGGKLVTVKDDLTGLEFNDTIELVDLYYTGDLIEVKIASCDITIQRNQTGSYSSETWLPEGAHNVKITTDYYLSQAPTLDTNKGSLGSFSGSEKIWTAVLTITSGGDGTLTFSDALLVNGAGTGTTINSGATHHQDTTAPTIASANFSITDWRGNDGAVTITVACGESTTGWTGRVNLSTWGGSSTQALSSSGNNMVVSFTPSITDAGPANATSIYVFDRAGNAANNNNYTSDNQLQTHDHRVEAEDLNFPAYLAVSEILSAGQTFTTTEDVLVTWGVMDGQFWPTGNLVYGADEDYVIDDNNKIHLDETKYADEIASNTLGLMFVNVREF